jgi:hypothetical protein
MGDISHIGKRFSSHNKYDKDRFYTFLERYTTPIPVTPEYNAKEC